MVEANAEASARGLLKELEDRLAAKDLSGITEVFTDDAILIGDDAEYLTYEGTVDYLGQMAEMEPVVRWAWEDVVATAYAPGVLGVTAVGSLGFYDASGELLAPRGPFRLTCVAIESESSWRIQQFHGSRPSD